jgi:tetratricopeptide (TPR) repeat protein
MDTIEKIEEKAVNAAIAGNWQEAIELNKSIILQEPNSVFAYLRLGFSAMNAQSFDLAQSAYKKVIELQPTNVIAIENIEKITILQKHTLEVTAGNLDPNLFLEIAGKTKIIHLLNLAQKEILAKLHVGQPLQFEIKKHHIEIFTVDKEYIGSLPDDVSKRLMYLITSECVYAAYIKEAALNKITVFLKEMLKSKKMAGYLSFPLDMQSNLNKLQAKASQSEEENDGVDESASLQHSHEEHTIEEDEDDDRTEIEKMAHELDDVAESAKDALLYQTQSEEETESEEE